MLERLPEFIGNHPIMSLIFIGLVVALIYTELARRFRGFAALPPAQLTRLINSGAELIDVSPQADFDRGHIVNARHFLPSHVDPQTKPFRDWRDRPVAVYCKNGVTSQQVCRKLVKAGFAKVHWLQGGLQAWVGEQLPVTKAK